MIRITTIFILLTLSFNSFAQFMAEVLPDSCKTGVFSYRSRNDLLIVPITINDSIEVNMILDPQCRSIILFGKRFYKKLTKNRVVASNHPQLEKNSEGIVLHNKLALGQLEISNATVVIVSNRNPVNVFTDVHGIMGYDGFADFNFSPNAKNHLLTVTPKEKPTEMARSRSKNSVRQ